MTEREVKQLLKLLAKFRDLKVEGVTDPYLTEGQGVVDLVSKWVKWYGHDELSMDL